MNIELPYDRTRTVCRLDIPHEVLVPNDVDVGEEAGSINEALARPLGAGPVSEFIAKSERLLVIVNDASRPTPTGRILEAIKDQLLVHKDVKFLVATGAHRAPTEEEYRFIFGPLFEEVKAQVVAHDARSQADQVFLGSSKNGTPLYINKLVQEYKNIIIIGSVEPHYFAGFTGGRKSFLPGVAGFKTIEMNHRLAMSAESSLLTLEGNPVHEDMADAMWMLKHLRIFSIQTVLTGDHRIYAVTAGDITLSFEDAIEKAKEVFCVKCKKKGNIVIAVAPYPMDIDLYQSQKALENGRLALEEGGIIILLSKCREGIGERAFLDLLASAPDCKGVMESIEKGYKLGYHKAAKLAQLGTEASIWAVTGLHEDTIRMAKMEPKKDIQSAVDEAVKVILAKGKKPYAVVLPQGSLTVPLLPRSKGKR